MTNSHNAEPQGPDVTKPLAKFLIGTLACATGVLLPPLAAFIQRAEAEKMLSPGYIALAAVFSAIVGGVVVVKEWGVPRKPWDTFMTGLGLPAALAGAISGYSGASRINQVKAETGSELTQTLQTVGIPIRPATQAPARPSGSWLLSPFVTTVHAAGRADTAGQAGVVVQEPQYWVVVGRGADRQKADQVLADLRPRLASPPPGKAPVKLEVVAYRSEFLVVEAGGGRKRAVAVARALELKTTFNVPVELQEIPK